MKITPKSKVKDLIVESKSAGALKPIRLVQNFSLPVKGFLLPKAKICNQTTFRSNTIRISKRQEVKYDKLMEKINSVPDLGTVSERVFKTTVKKNLKLLDDGDTTEKKEIKEVVDKFDSSVKANMFCITKTGQRFRKDCLQKRLRKVHKSVNN